MMQNYIASDANSNYTGSEGEDDDDGKWDDSDMVMKKKQQEKV
jgi:hypothetical protein